MDGRPDGRTDRRMDKASYRQRIEDAFQKSWALRAQKVAEEEEKEEVKEGKMEECGEKREC